MRRVLATAGWVRPAWGRSLTGRLLVLWSLSLAASVVGVVLAVGLARQSLRAGSERAAALAQTGCGLVRDQLAFYATGVPPGTPLPPHRDLAAVVTLALAGLPVTAGGIWQDTTAQLVVVASVAGAHAAAVLPSPQTLAPLIRQALHEDGAARQDTEGAVLGACPLPGPWPDLVAWVAVPADAMPGRRPGFGLGLRAGVGLLLVLILGIAAWSSRLLLAWRRALAGLERAVREAAGGGGGSRRALRPAGEPGLDRVVVALNDSTRQLAAAQARAAEAERLAALGRVAAGIAHEIRNPVAAIRLRAENAIAGTDARRAACLPAILDQAARLERLAGSLLDMTRPRTAHRAPCDPARLCAAIAGSRLAVSGRDASIELRLAVSGEEAMLDAELLEAALGNLVLNALQHARGLVVVAGGLVGTRRLRLLIADDGPGVSPSLRATLFDPFVTGRADGTGLGLAIASEAARAHGGCIRLSQAEEVEMGDPGLPATRFVLEVST